MTSDPLSGSKRDTLPDALPKKFRPVRSTVPETVATTSPPTLFDGHHEWDRRLREEEEQESENCLPFKQ